MHVGDTGKSNCSCLELTGVLCGTRALQIHGPGQAIAEFEDTIAISFQRCQGTAAGDMIDFAQYEPRVDHTEPV